MVNLVANRRGIGRLGCLAWIIVAIVLAYLGNSFGKPWFAYQQYRDEMKSAAAFAQALPDSAIRVRIVARADSLMLPVEARKVNIERTNERIIISSSYDVVVVIKFYGPVVLKFRPKISGPI